MKMRGSQGCTNFSFLRTRLPSSISQRSAFPSSGCMSKLNVRSTKRWDERRHSAWRWWGKLLRMMNCRLQWCVSFIQQQFVTFTDPRSVENHVKNLSISRVLVCPSIFSTTLLLLLALSSSSSSSSGSYSSHPAWLTPGEMVSLSAFGSLTLCFKSRSPCRLKSILSTRRLISSELVSSEGSGAVDRKEVVRPVPNPTTIISLGDIKFYTLPGVLKYEMYSLYSVILSRYIYMCLAISLMSYSVDGCICNL